MRQDTEKRKRIWKILRKAVSLEMSNQRRKGRRVFLVAGWKAAHHIAARSPIKRCKGEMKSVVSNEVRYLIVECLILPLQIFEASDYVINNLNS